MQQKKPKEKVLKEILSHKESWAVVIGRFFLEPIWWLFVGWMPIYLFDVYGFNVKEVGMFLWVPYVGAAIGSIVGGYVSGKIIAKTNSIDKGRKTTIFIGGVIMLLGLDCNSTYWRYCRKICGDCIFCIVWISICN